MRVIRLILMWLPLALGGCLSSAAIQGHPANNTTIVVPPVSNRGLLEWREFAMSIAGGQTVIGVASGQVTREIRPELTGGQHFLSLQ